MDIRIQAPTEEKFQEVLEALRPIGVEVITGEDNPLVTALFYLARINSKLDNLGQLRHLHKLIQHVGTFVNNYEKGVKTDERLFALRLNYNTWLYESLVEKHKKDPIKNAVGLDRGYLQSALSVLTSEEIRALFAESGVIKA